MKILIDMQGAQGESARRGIGRYSTSLAEALTHLAVNHEIVFLVNGDLPRPQFGEGGDYIEEVWSSSRPNDPDFSDICRKTRVLELNPDVVLVTSLFESPHSGPTVSLFESAPFMQVVILYDLIPLIHQELYLSNETTRNWYHQKIASLKQADLLLTISNATRVEALTLLAEDESKLVNISSAVDDFFRGIDQSLEDLPLVAAWFGVERKFILYTGGIDHRKNIEGLIEAYSLLDTEIKLQHQLVIVCSINQAERTRLGALASSLGVPRGRIIFSGYISDVKLRNLYNECDLFVFPSLHEGFGLPILEAMKAGAPVLTSNLSSMPEIVNYPDALFDPRDPADMAAKIERALTDSVFLGLLRENSVKRATAFSWSSTGKVALEAIERLRATASNTKNVLPKLAFVSPYPPDKSGIAVYSEKLIPGLSEFYDVTLIRDSPDNKEVLAESWNVIGTKEFRESASQFDRVVYQFGNSTFHGDMFDLLSVIPGVVVLHDFFLSGILYHLALEGSAPNAWFRAILKSHGYQALAEAIENPNAGEIIRKYPASLGVIEDALAVVVHSDYAVGLAQSWFGVKSADKFRVIPLPRDLEGRSTGRLAARSKIGLYPEDLLLVSAGFAADSKCSDTILEAFAVLVAEGGQHLRLVFVGQADGAFGDAMQRKIKALKLEPHVTITGWLSDEDYKNYLEAADIAVQLRKDSRGESSYSVLDAMAFGLPLIVNHGGYAGALTEEGAVFVSENPSAIELADAMRVLVTSPEKGKKLAQAASEDLAKQHSVAICVQKYHRVIEETYGEGQVLNHQDFKVLSREKPRSMTIDDWARAVTFSREPTNLKRQLLLDITGLPVSEIEKALTEISETAESKGIRLSVDFAVEPIYRDAVTGTFYYARSRTIEALVNKGSFLADEVCDFSAGDILLSASHKSRLGEKEYSNLTRAGVRLSSLSTLFGEVERVIQEPYC